MEERPRTPRWKWLLWIAGGLVAFAFAAVLEGFPEVGWVSLGLAPLFLLAGLIGAAVTDRTDT